MSVVVEKGRKVLRSCEEKEGRTWLELEGSTRVRGRKEGTVRSRRVYVQYTFSFGVRVFGRLLVKVTTGNLGLVTCLSQRHISRSVESLPVTIDGFLAVFISDAASLLIFNLIPMRWKWEMLNADSLLPQILSNRNKSYSKARQFKKLRTSSPKARSCKDGH